MRRLPGILLLTVATLIVIVALLVSGLRLVLPQLDAWRPQLLEKISTLTGTPVDASADHRQLADFWSDVRRPRYPCRAERWRHNGGQARNPGAGCLAEPAAYALAVPRPHLLAAAGPYQYPYSDQ